MSSERLALAWSLVLILALLLGLVVAVVAFGVVRRMRRPRGKRDDAQSRRGDDGVVEGDYSDDRPRDWRSRRPPEDEE